MIRPAILLGLLLLVVQGAIALVLYHGAGDLFDRGVHERLESRAERVDVVLDGWGRSIADALADLEEDLERHDPARRERWLAGGSAVVDDAERWMRLAQLDFLTVLDATGTVVTCGHWPERAGLADPSLARLVPERAVIHGGEYPAGERPLLVVPHRIDDGDRQLVLVGGRKLDGAFLDQVAGGALALLFHLEGRAVTGVERSGSPQLDPDTFVASVQAETAGHAVVEGVGGRPWSVFVRELRDSSGRRRGALLLTADRAGIDALERRFARLLAALVAAGTLLGGLAGAWAGRRGRRPLRQLVGIVEAIGSGRADHAFSTGEQDESEELADAFSRLQRSLELQRERAAAAERVAAWSEIARHVAHEVKNPLVPIRLTVENLIRARSRDAQTFDELFDEGSRTILEEVERLRRLVAEFSEFARLPSPAPSPVRVDELVDGVLDLYAAEPGLQIERRHGRQPGRVELDPDQIHRALQNVVGNAVQALRDAGNTNGRLEVTTSVSPDAVDIEVADNGPGLSPEVRARIFEPYFTTRGQGTGLGMAITYRIVTEHGGTVTAENRTDGGARIRIRLPPTRGEEPEPCRPS